MKKLLTRIIGIVLFICGFSANAGNNFNVLDRNFSRDYIVDTAIHLAGTTYRRIYAKYDAICRGLFIELIEEYYGNFRN